MTSNLTNTDMLTCVTCNVAFKDAELHRSHFKSDWHRYNLKRRVADLTAVTFQDFTERVRIQNAQIENEKNQENEEMFCKLCSKHFSTANSFANHQQSKKHKELHELAANKLKQENDEKTAAAKEELLTVKSDRTAKKMAQMEEYLKKYDTSEVMEVGDDADLDDKEWEEIDEDELEEQFDESKIIPLTDCLFCEKKFEKVEDKCEHMANEHSFFIPDAEYCTDIEGLMKFLGMKLGVYHVCLWCSSKCYKDLLSVQKHMQDKGHQKMKFQGETLLEYTEFYTYEGDTTIDDEYEIVDMNSSRSTIMLGNDENGSFNEDACELVLPSGATIGHRSLFRYYKQSFGHRNLEVKLRQNISIKDKYRAIASGGSLAYNTEIQKQRKDMTYFKRWSAKMHAKLGCESNKLQKHYRRQNITF